MLRVSKYKCGYHCPESQKHLLQNMLLLKSNHKFPIHCFLPCLYKEWLFTVNHADIFKTRPNDYFGTLQAKSPKGLDKKTSMQGRLISAKFAHNITISQSIDLIVRSVEVRKIYFGGY